MQRLYLSTPGILNALGDSPSSVWQNLLRKDQRNMALRAGLLTGGDVHAGVVNTALPDIDKHLVRFNSRNNRLLLAAYRQIAGEVEQLIARYGKNRIAVVLGSSTTGISDTEAALKYRQTHGEFPPDYYYEQHEMGSPALFLASLLELDNAAMTVSTACSSSARAFITARNLIHAGFCDAALVGGVDTLCRMTINGFHALESISPKICNPFSRNRNGITIGEAAALFILSPEPAPVELAGAGLSSDAYHMSAPDPTGAGAEAAMRQALQNAGITPDDIAYINLHGTATIKNDEMEAAAVNRVFGPGTPCSSTKALTGHTLGAAGATELALCWLALSPLNSDAQLPPHVWDGERDERLAAVNLVRDAATYDKRRECYMISNSFAFGGNNVALIIKNHTRPTGEPE